MQIPLTPNINIQDMDAASNAWMTTNPNNVKIAASKTEVENGYKYQSTTL